MFEIEMKIKIEVSLLQRQNSTGLEFVLRRSLFCFTDTISKPLIVVYSANRLAMWKKRVLLFEFFEILSVTVYLSFCYFKFKATHAYLKFETEDILKSYV